MAEEKDLNIKIRVQQNVDAELKKANAAMGQFDKSGKEAASGVTNDLNKIETKAKETGTQLQKTSTESIGAFGKLKTGVGSALSSINMGFVMVTAAVIGFAHEMKAAAEEWIKKETSLAQINAAIRTNGENFNTAKKEIMEYSDKMKSLGIDEDIVLKATAQLERAGYDHQKAIDIVNTSLGLSFERYGNVEQGMGAVARLSVGVTRGYKQLGVEIKAGADHQTVYNKVMAKSEEGMRGLQNYAETTSAKLKSLDEITITIKEEIGRGLVGGLTNAIGTGKDFNKNVEETFNWLKKVGDFIGVWLIPGFSAFGTTVKAVVNLIEQPFFRFMTLMVNGIDAISMALKGDYAGALRMAKAATTEFFKDSVSETVDNLNKMKNAWADYVNDAGKRQAQLNKFSQGADTGKSGKGYTEPGGGTGKAQTVGDFLSQKQLEIENEILNKKLEGNKALEYERAALTALLPIVEKQKDSLKEQVEIKKRIHDIDQDFQKQRDDAYKKEQDEIQKEAEDFAAEIEKEDKLKAEQLKKEEEELAAWLIRKKELENKAAVEQSEYRQKEGEAGIDRSSGKAYGTSAFKILFGGGKNMTNVALYKEWTATYEKMISVQKQLARASGDEFDETQVRFDALIEKMKEYLEAGKEVPKELTKAVQKAHFQLDAEAQVKAGKEAAKQNADAMAEAQQQAIQQEYQQRHDMIKGAVETGMKDGAAAGAKSLADAVKAKLMDSVAESLTDAIMGGGGNSKGGFLSTLGGLFGGGKGKGGAASTAGTFAGGWSAMDKTAGAMSGAANTETGAAAAGGVAGMGAMGYIGLAIGIASMFGLGQKKKSQEQTGVKDIFSGPTVRGENRDALYGSSLFDNATFSSRNQGNKLLQDRAASRAGGKITLEINPSDIFATKVKSSLSGGINLETIHGVANRTGHTHF